MAVIWQNRDVTFPLFATEPGGSAVSSSLSGRGSPATPGVSLSAEEGFSVAASEREGEAVQVGRPVIRSCSLISCTVSSVRGSSARRRWPDTREARNLTTSVVQEALRIAAEAGVRRLYTVPGESFLPLLDTAQHEVGIQVVSTRHESGAAFMADADAKVSGVPAIVSGTRAVGAANLSIGVHAAYQDSTPMIALVGQVRSSFVGREAFQEIDLPAFYRPLVKSAVSISRGDMLPEALARGLRLAMYGRPGPVMIAVSADLFEAECEPSPHLRRWHPVPVPLPGRADVEELGRVLRRASRPVILAGLGARPYTSDLVAVAEKLGIGVYATFRHQDVFPNNHPNYLGHLTFSTSASVRAALAEADVVLTLGARLDEISTQEYQLPTVRSRLYQVDIDPALLASQVGARSILGDVGETLRLLAADSQEVTERSWADGHRAYLTDSSLPDSACSSPVAPADVIRGMREVLPPDTLVTNDAGNHSGFLHKFYRFNQPHTQISTTSGAMGYGIPAAIGAKLADPCRTVVSVVGDGGFMMTGNELETAVRLNVPVTIIVMRNGMYGTIAMHQAREMGRTTAIDIGEIDIAGSARTIGADGVTVSNSGEFKSALRSAIASERPTVLDVVCDPDAIAPGISLATMFAHHRSAAEAQ